MRATVNRLAGEAKSPWRPTGARKGRALPTFLPLFRESGGSKGPRSDRGTAIVQGIKHSMKVGQLQFLITSASSSFILGSPGTRLPSKSPAAQEAPRQIVETNDGCQARISGPSALRPTFTGSGKALSTDSVGSSRKFHTRSYPPGEIHPIRRPRRAGCHEQASRSQGCRHISGLASN
jgi:hypothetical protein